MPETIVAAIHQTERLGTLWCALMHDSTMWPIHGEYRCRTCAAGITPCPGPPKRWFQSKLRRGCVQWSDR